MLTHDFNSDSHNSYIKTVLCDLSYKQQPAATFSVLQKSTHTHTQASTYTMFTYTKREFSSLCRELLMVSKR